MSTSTNKQPKPLVSVAVITYNQIDYIHDCLNGLVNQACDFSYEIVVGDDCSTDGTREVIRQYKSNYPGLINGLMHESNLGAVPNFLAVLKACQGDFIAICEGDDYWIDSQKLARQVAVLQQNYQCDLIFHPALGKFGDASGDDRLFSYYGRLQRLFPAKDMIIGRGGFMPTAAIMFRQSVVERIPDWFGTMVGCDYHLKVLAASRGGALYIPYIMSVYRLKSKGSWSEKYIDDGAYEVHCLRQAWERSFDLQEMLESQHHPAFDMLRRSYLMQLMVSKNVSRSDKINFLSLAKKEITIITYMMAFVSLNMPGICLLKRFLRSILNLKSNFNGQHLDVFKSSIK